MSESSKQHNYSKLFSVYLHQSYHLTLCIFFLTAYTYRSFTHDVDWKYCIWVSLVTFLLYNYYPLVNIKLKDFGHFFMRNLPLFLLIILSGIMGTLLMYDDLMKLSSLSVALVITYFYFKKHPSGEWSGRDHYLYKPVAIGFVYAILTLFIPAQDVGLSVSESLLLAVGRMSFIMALALIFDICDIRENTDVHYPTFPEMFGIKKTKMIISVLIFMSFIIETIAVWSFLTEIKSYVALMITLFLTFILSIMAHRYRPFWYSLLLTDSMMMVPYCIIILL